MTDYADLLDNDQQISNCMHKQGIHIADLFARIEVLEQQQSELRQIIERMVQ